MGELQKLTLEDLKNIGEIKPTIRTNKYVFYIREVTDLTSHIFKQLLYRLENLETSSVIVLGDSGKVLKKDIEAGIFVDGDRGKDKCRVLRERYAPAFKTTIVEGRRGIHLNTLLKKNTNVVVIEGSGSHYTEDKIKELQGSQLVQLGINIEVHIIEVFYNGRDIHVRTKNINGKRLIGSGDELIERNQGIALPELYMLNSMASQLVFNKVNNLITEGMSYNYGKVSGDMVKGKLVKEYVRKTGENSIFNIVTVPGYFPLSREGEKLDKEFKEFSRFKSQKVNKDVRRLVESSKIDIIQNYINQIEYQSETTLKLNTVKEDEGKLEVLKELMGYTLKEINKNTRKSLGEISGLVTIASYVETNTTGLF